MTEKSKKIFFRITLLILSVGINCLGSFIARNISLPLYLDSVLTIGVTAISGLWWGIVCAVLSNVTLYLFDYSMLPFTLCHILTAVCAWLTFRHNIKTQAIKGQQSGSRGFSMECFLWAGFWCGLSNALSGNLISDFLFSVDFIPILRQQIGVDNIDNAVRAIYIATGNLRVAIYLGGLITNLVDKFISATVSFLLYKLIYNSSSARSSAR